MGCRLPKLRKAEERRSPGNIYSTLRRPQVETKVGVAYTYHFLDFLLGKEEVPVSSVLCLSSVRELPVQVRELYAQGFVLVAVHPFVHSCGPRHAHIQRQLHRAVLVRETPSSEKSQLRWGGHRLETDVCVAGHQSADPEMIQSYVKRIQDVAEQGVMFVGFLQQPGGGPTYLGHWDPDELSSLHSSPSPIHRHPFSAKTSPTDPAEPPHCDAEATQEHFDYPTFKHQEEEQAAPDHEPLVPRKPDVGPLKPIHNLEPNPQESGEQLGGSQISLSESPDTVDQPQYHRKPSVEQLPAEDQENQRCPSPLEAAAAVVTEQSSPPVDPKDPTGQQSTLTKQRERQSSSSDSWLSSPELDRHHDRRSSSTTHNNNHIRLKSSEKDKESPPQARMQLFALYNHTGQMNTSLRFYSLRVPLRVQKEAGLITEVDTHWLDHMTQHFTSGAHLIDGFFHLQDDKDNGVSSVDSVFIFQSSAEETAHTSYDAIVVEQWTVVDGVVVKADYIPLLQSLAPYGWRLMCVLPTPIVKTNSDGSLSTKQILFLQRPILQRKRKDFKMLSLRGRSKAKKKSTGGAPEEREDRSPVMETEMDRLRGNAAEEQGEEEEEEEEEGEEEEGARHSQKGAGESEGDARHQRGLSLLPGSRAWDEEREEETDVDMIPASRQEKSVRWTDVCQRDDGGGLKEEARKDEPIKLQLFSGVC